MSKKKGDSFLPLEVQSRIFLGLHIQVSVLSQRKVVFQNPVSSPTAGFSYTLGLMLWNNAIPSRFFHRLNVSKTFAGWRLSSHPWPLAAAGHSHALFTVPASAGGWQPGALLRGHLGGEEVGQREEAGGLCDYLRGDVPVVMKQQVSSCTGARTLVSWYQFSTAGDAFEAWKSNRSGGAGHWDRPEPGLRACGADSGERIGWRLEEEKHKRW